jgi:hypothetical protein
MRVLDAAFQVISHILSITEVSLKDGNVKSEFVSVDAISDLPLCLYTLSSRLIYIVLYYVGDVEKYLKCFFFYQLGIQSRC